MEAYLNFFVSIIKIFFNNDVMYHMNIREIEVYYNLIKFIINIELFN